MRVRTDAASTSAIAHGLLQALTRGEVADSPSEDMWWLRKPSFWDVASM